MIVKVNGNPLSPITTHGIDVKYDLNDIAVDAYHIIHTPVNVDLAFAGHNIVKGDVNVFNWTQGLTESLWHHAAKGANLIVDAVF